MGTNLSQVFISNLDTPVNKTAFNDAALFTAPNPAVGIWADGAYKNWGTDAPLYTKTVDVSTAADADDAADVITLNVNPFWRYKTLQITQGTAGNPIATPMLNVRDVRKIKYEKHVPSVRHSITTGDIAEQVTVKFIIRTTPTAQLNFHDPNGSGLIDLSGGGFDFPLGGFNTTNHKAINIGGSTAATVVANIQGSPILNAMFTAATSTNAVAITARHAGVIFDVIVSADDDGAIVANGSTTKGLVGVGNSWQALDEEIRCRSRYGNFNRMYIPQNMPTYTNSTFKYDKITVEYEHNWPNSTGIAPAGALNQAVIYLGDSSTALAASDFDQFEAAFSIALATNEEFVW